MNDNDLIKRGDAKATLGQLTLYCAQIDGDSVFVVRYTEAYDALDDILSAPQEMSAVEYERISRRFSDWCASTLCAECSFFDDCPQTSPDVLQELTPEQYVAAIQKWAREHPEERSEE